MKGKISLSTHTHADEQTFYTEQRNEQSSLGSHRATRAHYFAFAPGQQPQSSSSSFSGERLFLPSLFQAASPAPFAEGEEGSLPFRSKYRNSVFSFFMA